MPGRPPVPSMISTASRIEILCDASALKYRVGKPVAFASSLASNDIARPRTGVPAGGIVFVYDLYPQSSLAVDEVQEFPGGAAPCFLANQ